MLPHREIPDPEYQHFLQNQRDSYRDDQSDLESKYQDFIDLARDAILDQAEFGD